jgi:HlyD family secretion protein
MVSQTTPHPFKNRTLWIALALLLLMGGISLWTVRSFLTQRQAEQEQEALPPPERVSVAALGRVEPQGRVIEVASPEQGVVERILVKKGDKVKQGQILAYLDIYDVRKAERDYAESQVIEARNKLAAEVQAGEAKIDEANSRIAQVDQPQLDALKAQEAVIDSLDAQRNLAILDLDRTQDLYDQGALSRQELDRRITDVSKLNSDIASAQAMLTQMRSTWSANMSNANAQVDSAQADLQRSQANTSVASAERNLALAETKLERAVIKAPEAGQILDITVYPGESVTDKAVFSLGNTEQMYIVAEVYETDVGLVKVGQPVTIKSRNGAFSETLTGKVAEVGLQIFKNDVIDDDPAANADARVVEVRVAVDQDAVIAGLTNLQVDALIDITGAKP